MQDRSTLRAAQRALCPAAAHSLAAKAMSAGMPALELMRPNTRERTKGVWGGWEADALGRSCVAG